MPNACTFICGDDDFLVTRQGKKVFEEKSADCEDEFSKEILDGMVQKVDEVASVISQVQQATQTMSMFGGKKTVWLKDINFISESRTGNSEETKARVAHLQDVIGTLDPESVSLVITACPVDRRRKEFKWFPKNTDFTDIKGGDGKGLAPLIAAECEKFGVSISSSASNALIGKVGGNTRLVIEEIRKMASYLGDSGEEISERLVTELVPNFGEGDMWETTEAFFSYDLQWTLDALNRHFFIYSDARAILASMQNRNRLLIQLRSLVDGGAITVGYNGIPKPSFEKAAEVYSQNFGDLTDKSSFNVFTQNLWYLGNKVGKSVGKQPLRRLIDFQIEFTRTFEGIISRPNEQHAVMNELAVRCLS